MGTSTVLALTADTTTELQKLLTVTYVCENYCIVSQRYFKVALFVILLGAVLFVVDVLSPATATPRAESLAQMLLIVFSVLLMAGFSQVLTELVPRRRLRESSHNRASRTLLVWLQVLLF